MHIYSHTINDFTGYGKVTMAVLRCFGPDGATLSSREPIPEKLLHLKRDRRADLAISNPFDETPAPVIFTFWESDVLPAQAVKNLSTSRKRILVSSTYNKETFIKSGVKTPITVCPPPITPRYYIPPQVKPFTFLNIAEDSGSINRKRSEDVIQAFQHAFPEESDVLLIVKKSPLDKKIPCYDTRIQCIYSYLSDEDYRRLLLSAHLGVFLSGLEGWGLPYQELAAIGRPSITPFFGGPKDILDSSCAYGLPFRLIPTPKHIYGGIGRQGYSSVSDCAKAMRFAYANKDDVTLKGVLAYRRMFSFSFDSFSQIIYETLSPLRRHGRSDLQLTGRKTARRRTVILKPAKSTWTSAAERIQRRKLQLARAAA